MVEYNNNGVKKRTKLRRTTALTEIEIEDEYRFAYGVVQLMQEMNHFPEVGKSYHFLSGGKIDMLCHLQWLFIHKKRLKHIFISAWSISGRDLMMIDKWHKQGKVGAFDIIVSDVYPTRFLEEWKLIGDMQSRGVIANVWSSIIHAKVLLVECDDGTKVVVEGSANCHMNPRIEQSVVTVSERLFDFYHVYFTEFLEEDQIKKAAKVVTKELDLWAQAED